MFKKLFPGWIGKEKKSFKGREEEGGNSREKEEHGASLVAQWLRICLPMQGTRVRALVWGDPTCRGAAGPVSHDY